MIAEFNEFEYDPLHFFTSKFSIQVNETTRSYAIGRGQQIDGKSGALQLRFTSFQPWFNSDVVATDYNSYALMFTCSDFLGISTSEKMWVLTR